jgi:hypothetical protein
MLRFVDRDMFMRFCGLGLGHRATHAATKVFRDEIAAIFGLANNDEGEATSIDVEGQQAEKDMEEDLEDELDGEGDGDDSEEEEHDIEGDDIIFEDNLDYAPL